MTACKTEEDNNNMTVSIAEDSAQKKSNIESVESEDYTAYSGTWTQSGITQEEVIQERVGNNSDDGKSIGSEMNDNVEMSEDEIRKTVYEKYYETWAEDDMVEAINERSAYYHKSAYYEEVIDYMENVREVRDISNVVEPLLYSDMKYYNKEDFKDVPKVIIHLEKNEIYARHGYIFRNEDLNNYFMGCIWYNPTCSTEEFDDSVFNQYEKANLELLAELDSFIK